MAKWPEGMSEQTMINYERLAAAWAKLVDLGGPGVGPWEVQHSRELGWCVKRPRVTGTRPLIVETKREAVAVCAALNAVSR